MSFTGIGRIGSQHTLKKDLVQDEASYLFNADMWCTHQIGTADFLNSGSFELTEGSNIVTSGNTTFTLLCKDMQVSNVPLNRYIIYYGNTTSNYGVLQVDYVIDDFTLVLKYPAPETDVVNIALTVKYWETPILKEVEIRNPDSPAVLFTYANKYSSITPYLGAIPYIIENEGGVEPMLVSQIGVLTTLKY